MDVQLQELIDKIKTEGVKKSEEESAKIIADAQEKAKQIIKDAEKQANSLKEQSQKESALNKQSSIDAVKQASRDIVIELKKEIEGIFNLIIKSNTSDVFSGNSLELAILKIIENWDKDNLADISVLLPESDLDKVKKFLNEKLAKEILNGLEIKPNKNLDIGFQISQKDGNSYFDFSADGIAQLIYSYLSPQLAGMLIGEKEA